MSDLRDAVLARYVVRGTGFEEAPVAAAEGGGPDPELCARAREAFEAFCAAPDGRFDPLWYRWAVPGAHGLAEEALIAHYRDHAGAGVSPGPGFDEIAARRMTPALVPVIEAGSLPCAFAMELVQGRGALNSLAHLPPQQARAMALGRVDSDDLPIGPEGRACRRAPAGAAGDDAGADEPVVGIEQHLCSLGVAPRPERPGPASDRG